MLLTHDCFEHCSDEWKENSIRELRVMEDVEGWVDGYKAYLEGQIAKYEEANKEQWRDKTPDEYARTTCANYSSRHGTRPKRKTIRRSWSRG